MKKLVLTGRQITLLCKVSEVKGFYGSVEDFLDENENLPDGETAGLELVNEDHFNDVLQMVYEYLNDDNLDDEQKSTDQERAELQALAEQLNLVQPEEDTEEE